MNKIKYQYFIFINEQLNKIKLKILNNIILLLKINE